MKKQFVLENGQVVRVGDRKPKRSIVFKLISAFMWVWALSLVIVFSWGVLVSFADGIYYAADMSKIFPKIWKFNNYLDAFSALEIEGTNFWGMTWNSIWFSTSFSLIKVAVTAMGAYVTARYKFKARKFLYAFIVVQMMLPQYGTTVANYKLLDNLGLIDTPLQIIAFGAGHGMMFLMIYSFFLNLPSDYEDAGRIDGASEYVICFKLMMPMATPMIIALMVSIWTGMWNNAEHPLLYLPSYPTLSSGIFRYRYVAAYTLDIPIYFSGIIMSAIPPTVIFMIFSDTIMKNMTVGGLKG